jgi:ABC-type multidrug transport system ATPase subunit
MELTNVMEVDGLRLEFDGKKVLGDIYLRVETGKITGLLGPNGAGKSCLLDIIFGELTPPDRSVRINGHPLLGNHRSIHDLRYLPQFGFIPKKLTLKRVLADFKLDFGRLSTHFPEFEKYYLTPVSHLSGGEARLLEVFVIIASETKFCLLDEPFSAIMPIHVEVVKSLLVEEKNKKGIFITDHLYKHVIDLQDSLYLLNNGKTYLAKSIDDIEYYGYARLPSKQAAS